MISTEIENIDYAYANGIVFVLEKKLIKKQEFVIIAGESFEKCVNFIESKNKIYAGEFREKDAAKISMGLRRIAKKFYSELAFFYPEHILKPFSLKHELYEPGLFSKLSKEKIEEMIIKIDKEIFAEKRKLAERTKSREIKNLIACEIDLNNLKSVMRAIKNKKDVKFMEKILIEGGKIGKKEIMKIFENYEENKIRTLFSTFYGEKAKKIELFYPSPHDFDRSIDNILISLARELGKKTLGEEPLVAYIYAFENEIKNCGILLKGKAYDLEEKEIISLLRETYV